MPAKSPYQAYELQQVSETMDTMGEAGPKLLTVTPKDQISVGVPHLRFSIASGLLNIWAPITCPFSPSFR